jgi:putative intracellular protease/amidase
VPAGHGVTAWPAHQGIEQVELTAKADIFPVDHAISEADPARYDGLVLPGGVANRGVPAAVLSAAPGVAGDGRKIICEDKQGWRWDTY